MNAIIYTLEKLFRMELTYVLAVLTGMGIL